MKEYYTTYKIYIKLFIFFIFETNTRIYDIYIYMYIYIKPLFFFLIIETRILSHLRSWGNDVGCIFYYVVYEI